MKKEIEIKTLRDTYNCIARDFDTMPTRWEIFLGGKLCCTFTWTDDNYGLEETNPVIRMAEKELEEIQRSLERAIESIKSGDYKEEALVLSKHSRIAVTLDTIEALRAPADKDEIDVSKVLAVILENQIEILQKQNKILEDQEKLETRMRGVANLI